MTPHPDRAYFAAFLDLRGKAAVVVGGGEVGEGKVEALLRSGARVTVVAPAVAERLARWARSGTMTHVARRFEPQDLEGAAIAIAATNDTITNTAVAKAARSRGIPVNVVDDASQSTFIMPAVIDRGPVQIAVSTAGASPVIATRIASLVSAAVPAGYGRLAALAREFRAAAKSRLPDVAARRQFWQRVVDGPIGRKALEGADEEARAMLERELGEASGKD
jgi:uroporphyrin-III C-methyltransferase / precorrin-2 dehydrogenase / sirohydrochlorin ferrochelatase